MQRGIFFVAAGVPVVVCLLVGALWARSGWYADRIGHDGRATANHWYWSVTSERGRITAHFGKHSLWLLCPSRSKPRLWNAAVASNEPRPKLSEVATFETTSHGTNVGFAVPHGAIVAAGGLWLLLLLPLIVFFSREQASSEGES